MKTYRSDRIGRFLIDRELGRGSQGTVYLATDPFLQREVAIKTLHLNNTSQETHRSQLLREARTVSKLQHPNIIPIYEAGEQEGTPYLVFEYVDGVSLKQLLQEEGELPVFRAVTLVSQILDGITYAHQHGIVHRDLSPANILIDKNGIPRVMDFGISKMVDGAEDAGLEPKGTLNYMSPEHFSKKPIGPSSDVFALGLILYEMLVGNSAVDAENEMGVMYKIVHQPIAPPSLRNSKVDANLDRVVLKALKKEPKARYSDAQAMKKELDTYLGVQGSGGQPQTEDKDTHSTVDFLFRRLSRKTDFPIFSKYIVQINEMASSTSKASADQLARVILNDYSLTNRLLRMVNSASYGEFKGGITSVSQAVVILGFEQVRMAAMSLMLFTQLQNKSSPVDLEDAVISSFVSAIIARDLAVTAKMKEKEEAFICALFQNLGRILTIYYFPEEHGEIKDLVARRGLDDKGASRSILGISYDKLGVSVARAWKFPENIIYCMEGLREGKVEKADSKLDRLRHLSTYANELCHICSNTMPSNNTIALETLAQRFESSFPISQAEVSALLDSAVAKVKNYSDFLGINVEKSGIIQRLIHWANLAMGADSGADADGRSTQKTLTDGPTTH